MLLLKIVFHKVNGVSTAYGTNLKAGHYVTVSSSTYSIDTNTQAGITAICGAVWSLEAGPILVEWRE